MRVDRLNAFNGGVTQTMKIRSSRASKQILDQFWSRLGSAKPNFKRKQQENEKKTNLKWKFLQKYTTEMPSNKDNHNFLNYMENRKRRQKIKTSNISATVVAIIVAITYKIREQTLQINVKYSAFPNNPVTWASHGHEQALDWSDFPCTGSQARLLLLFIATFPLTNQVCHLTHIKLTVPN